MSEFDRMVLSAESELVAYRRFMHQHPEISFEEYGTTDFIVEKLMSFGSIQVARPTKTGVVARIFGTKCGTPRVVGIRADIDALPMEEENNLPYRSAVPNVMHACGHDGHAAILLTLAKLLSASRDDFCGEARLIFQHAEELPPGGAIEMLRAGAVDGVDFMLALHLSSNWPVGVFGVRAGALTAAVDSFSVEVYGKGGHCAFPEQTQDPILAASQIVIALQSIVSRRIAATDAAVISVCQIHGGTAYNIIPETVSIQGSVRSFSEDTRSLIESEIGRIAEHTAAAAHASCKSAYHRGYPSVVNDAALTDRCEEILLKRFGSSHVERIERIMPGEDYAYFVQDRPGFFVELGTRNAEKLCDRPHHSGAYRMDEDAMRYGVQYYLDAVRTLLNGAIGEDSGQCD